MCSNCVDYGFLTSHEPTQCPRKAMLHCSHCAVYGHTFETCLEKPDPRTTEPVYMEQLLPFHVLEQYNITTKTPLPTAKPVIPLSPYPKERGVIAFVDDKRVIREFLQARGIKPLSGQLYTQLQEYARSQGKRLLKISRPAVERNAAVKSGKTAKKVVEDDEEESDEESSDDEEDESSDEEESDDEESDDDEESSDEED